MSVPAGVLAGVVLLCALLAITAAAEAIIQGLRGSSWTGAKQRSEAEARAAALLQRLLTPTQREQLEQHGYVEVDSPSINGRIYRIPADPARVQVYEATHITGTLCIAPRRWIPNSDVMLAHKLMIEGAEQQYLATANFMRSFPL